MPGNRKYKRNSEDCKRYTAEHRREVNKAIKQERHLAKHPADVGNNAVVNYSRKKRLSPLDSYLKNNLHKSLTKK